MNRIPLVGAGIVAALVILFAMSCFYTINQTEQAVLLQFDAPREIVTEPGLHAKIPWVQQVEYIDKRLLNLDAPAEEVIAQDKKRMVVDAFARWRIVDPLRFYQTLTNTDIATVTKVFGFWIALGGTFMAGWLIPRIGMMASLIIGTVAGSVQNSAAIYARMIQERKREAFQFRAEGSEISQRVKARAEREVTVITADATRQSEILRGQGDAQKTKILADAYGQDPDFFAFYRSMQAYQDSLTGGSTTMVLSPNSEFFRYLGTPQPGGAARKK